MRVKTLYLKLMHSIFLSIDTFEAACDVFMQFYNLQRENMSPHEKLPRQVYSSDTR